MHTRIILVRHLEISAEWRGRCYGASDVPLSSTGKAASAALAIELARHTPTQVVHSGLERTKVLATAITRHVDCPLIEDVRWREMDFGSWEGRPWTDIYAEVGDAMSNLIDEPANWAAPGGETVHAVRDRAIAALLELPRNRTVIVVSHGGPIGVIVGTLNRTHARSWPQCVPAHGAITEINEANREMLRGWLQFQQNRT